MAHNKLLLWTTAHFSVVHANFCFVPGYLIIEPLVPAPSIWSLSLAAQKELGVIQAECSRAVQELLRPERIYCLTFAEELQRYHCHIFPRSAEATAAYRREFPAEATTIRGPHFFEWVREKFRQDVSENSDVANLVDRLRHRLGPSQS